MKIALFLTSICQMDLERISYEDQECRFPTFVGIPPFFSPLFFFFFPFPRACIVCVATMRVNWWLSGQF